MKRILIVDDEPDLCEILKANVMAEGYEAEVAHSAIEAMAGDIGSYNLIILDVMMPSMSGFEMADSLREKGCSTPIIFLTAKDSEEDKLRGFSAGADDYVSKPFSVRELMARVKAVLARNTREENDEPRMLNFGELFVDLTRMTATLDGQPLNLTKTELGLLRLMLTNQGQVFSREQLLEKVWPKDVVVTLRTVDVNITRLRKKLGPYEKCIATRQGYGYLFDAENNA